MRIVSATLTDGWPGVDANLERLLYRPLPILKLVNIVPDMKLSPGVSPPGPRRDLLLLAAAAACWGLGTVVSKRAIAELPPLVLFPIQLTSSVVLLALLMRRARLPLAGGPPLLGRLGILNPGLAYALGLIGLTYISASLYVLLWAVEPLLIVLLAGIFLGEVITRRFVLLSAIAAAGMGLVVYDPATSGQWPGVVLTLAGVGCCAAYSVIAKRWVGSSDSTAQVVLAQQVYALGLAVPLAVIAALVGGTLRWSGVSPIALLSALGSGLLYYAAAYWFYLSAPQGAGVAGGDVLLSHPCFWRRCELRVARRAARGRPVGRSRRRPRGRRVDHQASVT